MKKNKLGVEKRFNHFHQEFQSGCQQFPTQWNTGTQKSVQENQWMSFIKFDQSVKLETKVLTGKEKMSTEMNVYA